MAMERSSYK